MECTNTKATPKFGYFQAGEEILITSSGHSQFQSETVKVLALISDRKVQLEKGVEYKHYGHPNAATVKGKEVDVRAQVGLLTRNIVIEGAPSSDR